MLTSYPSKTPLGSTFANPVQRIGKKASDHRYQRNHTATNNMAAWTWVLVLLFLQAAEVESEKEQSHDVETFGEIYELRQKLKQMEQTVMELKEFRAKFAVLGQQTRYARSLTEQGDSCAEKLSSCTERLGLWVELGRNITGRGERCNAGIIFAGRLLLQRA
uniref:SOAR domain-containing protein n=1 Tax=Globodera pallida TaxID=36090 RepID=A0A183CIT7_GLOPA